MNSIINIRNIIFIPAAIVDSNHKVPAYRINVNILPLDILLNLGIIILSLIILVIE